MIRKVFSLLSIALIAAGVANAQTVEPCRTVDANNTYKEYAPEIAKYEEQLRQYINARVNDIASTRSQSKGTAFGPDDTLHIPVVVHIVHDYGSEYIPDNDVYEMIDEINEVYLSQNTDLGQVINPFKPYIGNPKIMFHLAGKDPKGNPSNGITRHWSYLSDGGDDQAKLNQWDPSSYLNIWTTERIGRSPSSGQILAYAVFPASAAAIPYTDGILSGYSFIRQDKTIPHEIGHYLNLRHTWGNTAVATDCTGDDEVDDTPPTTGHFGNGDPYGSSAAGNCNSNAVLYDIACNSNTTSFGKILLDSTLFPMVTTTDGIGFDYQPLTNLNFDSVVIYPSAIGEEFSITHFKNNTPIRTIATKSASVGLESLGTSFAVSSIDSPDTKSGLRMDFGKYVWIDSLTIYPTTLGDTFEIKLQTFGKANIKTVVGVTNTTSGPQVVPFGAFIPNATYYRLFVSRNPGLKADSLTKADSIAFEATSNTRRTIPGVVTVSRHYDTTNQQLSDNSMSAYRGRYNFIYDIHIRYDGLTTTDSSSQTVFLDSFRADDVTATYSIKMTKNPGVYNDSLGAAPYVKNIKCIIDLKNETTNGRYCGLYSPYIRYGYIKNCVDYPDTVNTQNIMDYSNCPIMFTKGQVDRMRSALAAPVGNRDNLVNDTTHFRTGILSQIGGAYYSKNNKPDLKPVPDLSVESVNNNRTYYLCNTSNFRFRQRSWRDTITSVTMTFSNGATNPTITQTNTAQLNTVTTNSFSQPGWVDVTITATGNNGTGDSTKEFKQLVYAADANTAINPVNGFYMDFEQNDANNPIDKWPTFNYYNNDYKWQVMDNVGFTGSGCISYRAYDKRTGSQVYTNTPDGDFDDFFTPAFDLTGMVGTECRLNFMTSGAFRVSDSRLMQDELDISYSTNCGETWIPLKKLDKADIGNKGTVTVEYSPLWHGDWKLQSIDIPVDARQSRVFFRFRYRPGVDDWTQTVGARRMLPGTGNHFYIDRINISPYKLGVNTLLTGDKKVALAPNPTTGSSQLIIKSTSREEAKVLVTDVTGKVVYTTSQMLNGSINTVEIPASAIKVKGVYMIHVQAGNEQFTEKLISY